MQNTTSRTAKVEKFYCAKLALIAALTLAAMLFSIAIAAAPLGLAYAFIGHIVVRSQNAAFNHDHDAARRADNTAHTFNA